jgi:Ni,Fe-hydrogenase I cytochrome b subunit
MQFPLSFFDITIWLAITAIILLATSEYLSSHYGQATPFINRKRLRALALIVSMLLMFAVFVQIYWTITAINP